MSDPVIHSEAPSLPPAGRVAQLSARERRAEALLAAALLTAVLAMAAWLPGGPALRPWVAVLLVATFALCGRARFWVAGGYTVPIQLAFVGMLVLLPTPFVPLFAAAGMLVSRLPDVLRGRVHADRLLVLLPDAWYAVGPALVLGLAGGRVLSGGSGVADAEVAAVMALAFAAQVGSDVGVGMLRDLLAYGDRPRLSRSTLDDVVVADAALAPVGLVIAFAARDHPAALLAVLPLVALLSVFAREREGRLSQADELAHAYRGTALLMSDLLEADDAYTGGEHSRDVVELAAAVGARLGLDAAAQRDLEFGALLHDIGKIHVPNAILNKPAQLDAAEWEVIKRHPEDGQRMLERVGGALSRVGVIVRGHHEAFDGGGYPDGLAGEAIPLASRIISACDAFSAMTTTRSYRAAMPVADAIAELRRCAGTQFDPAVVAAVEASVEVVHRAPAPAATDAVPVAA